MGLQVGAQAWVLLFGLYLPPVVLRRGYQGGYHEFRLWLTCLGVSLSTQRVCPFCGVTEAKCLSAIQPTYLGSVSGGK